MSLSKLSPDQISLNLDDLSMQTSPFGHPDCWNQVHDLDQHITWNQNASNLEQVVVCGGQLLTHNKTTNLFDQMSLVELSTQTELPEFSEIIVEERDNFSFLDDDIFQDQAKWDSDVTYQQQIAVLQNSFIQDDHLPTVQCPVHIPVREGQSSEQFSLPLEDSEIILSGDNITRELSLFESSPNPNVTSNESNNSDLRRSTKCRICKNEGARHFNYYGCKGVCTSCRSFFRRSVQTGQYKDFRCSSAACKIESKNRKSCKNCRFKKCLAEGMKVQWVQRPDENCSKTISRLLIRSKFTTEEMNFVHHLEKVFTRAMFELYYSAFASDITAVRDWIQACAAGQILSYEIIQKMEVLDQHILSQSALKLMAMENLTFAERSALISCNLNKFLAYTWAVFYFPDIALDFAEGFIQYGIENQHQTGTSAVLKALEGLNFKEACKNSTYDIVYSSPWAPHIDIEVQHFNLTKVFRKWATTSSNPVPDKVQQILFEVILLLTLEDYGNFSVPKKCVSDSSAPNTVVLSTVLPSTSDPSTSALSTSAMSTVLLSTSAYSSSASARTNSVPSASSLSTLALSTSVSNTSTLSTSVLNRKNIENVQLKYILMLQRYLQDKNPKNAKSKFADGLMLLHHAKQLYTFHSQRLPF